MREVTSWPEKHQKPNKNSKLSPIQESHSADEVNLRKLKRNKVEPINGTEDEDKSEWRNKYPIQYKLSHTKANSFIPNKTKRNKSSDIIRHNETQKNSVEVAHTNHLHQTRSLDITDKTQYLEKGIGDPDEEGDSLKKVAQPLIVEKRLNHQLKNENAKPSNLNNETIATRFSTDGSLSVLKDSVKPGPCRRQSIAIRKTPSGNKNLIFLDQDSESVIDVPKKKHKLKKLGKSFLNCCSSGQEEVEENNGLPDVRQLGRDRLAKAIFKQGFNLRETKFKDLLSNEISEDYLKCIYMTCIYTNNNYFGAPGPRSERSEQLNGFIDDLFPLTLKVKKEYSEKGKKIKGPQFILNFKVIQARNLIATDPDGKSDPYCKVWLNGKMQDVKLTKVKEHTLDPTWDETFYFISKDVKKDMINIEIWDKDPIGLAENLKQIKNVKGIKGCWYFCTDFFDNICTCRGTVDDFIGKAQINVDSIYSEGVDKWLPLKTKKDEEGQGELHVAVKIEANKPKNTLDALKRHLLLVRICIEHGLQQRESPIAKISQWEQILKRPALTLLFQHSVQGNMTVSEDLACRFSVIIQSLGKEYRFSYEFIYSVLKETSDSMQHKDFFSLNPLEEIYNTSVENLKTNCFNHLWDFHSFRLTGALPESSDLEYILKSATLCQDIMGTSTSNELWSILKKEAQSWYLSQMEELQNITFENRNQTILDFLRSIKSYHIAADKVIQAVFLNETYTQLTYQIVDDVLSEPLRQQVSKIAEESRKSGDNTKPKQDALDIFIELKALADYLGQLSIPVRLLNLGKYYDWFNLQTIQDWFAWKQKLVTRQLDVLVSKDDLKNQLIECADRNEKQSTLPKSSSEVIEKELYELWKIVSDSRYPQCNKYFVQTLDYCSSKYVNGLMDLIEARKLLERGQEGLTMACVIANNLWSLAMYISKIMSEAEILQKDLSNIKLNLQIDCKAICTGISGEYAEELKNLIINVAGSRTRKKQEASLTEYLKFINKTLQLIAITDMAFEIYLLFLHEIWKIVVEEVAQQQDASIKRNDCLYKLQKCFRIAAEPAEGLYKVLKETEKVLYFDEKGKLKEIFFNTDYNSLTKYLQKKMLYG